MSKNENPAIELSDERIKAMWRDAQDGGLTVAGAPSVRFARAVIADALAALAEVKVDEQAGAEELAERFIAAEIDRAPEQMRRLGEYLANVLDEDQFKAASRMLLGAIEAAVHAASPALVSQSARQPLTDEQIYALFPRPHKDAMTRKMETNIARAVEAAHGIKP